MSTNPIIAEVTRGGIVESQHTGAYAVVDRDGRLLASAGDISHPVFPRSAVKAFQCLAMVESGAASRFGFNGEEIALACASHCGEADHVRVARSMLAKAGVSEDDYECGAHWPTNLDTQCALMRAGGTALAVHNNCSGKHAGMLALARQLGAEPRNYVDRTHPVQQAIARTIANLCDFDPDRAACGIDGCSVPTWAIPIRNLALGFARFTAHPAAQRIVAAVRAHPFMVAGTGRFDTVVMSDVPEVFVKGGAEGVHCACVQALGIGIAVKCDDGAGRAGEVAIASLLASLSEPSREKLKSHARGDLINHRGIRVGEIHATIFSSPPPSS